MRGEPTEVPQGNGGDGEGRGAVMGGVASASAIDQSYVEPPK